MSHDVGFYPYPETENDDDNAITYFFGYATGIFYRAFKAQHLNNGVSGANDGVIRSPEEIKKALEYIYNDPAYYTCPMTQESKGFQDVRQVIDTLACYMQAHPDQSIFIHYS
jgi:hypothetical protein